MYLFPLLSLGVAWRDTGSSTEFLSHFPSPAHELPKFTGNQERLHLLHPPSSLWSCFSGWPMDPEGPRTRESFSQVSDQSLEKPLVVDGAVSCSICDVVASLRALSVLGKGISAPELLDRMGRALLPAAPKDAMGWT